ncbi:EamA family transporter [Micromonospora sp. M12]
MAVQLLREGTGLSPVSIGFHRLAIAALVLLACTAGRLRTMVATLRAAPVPLLLTGVGLGLYQALYFAAVAWAGVSVATIVSLGLAPVLAAAWESVHARRLPGPLRLGTLLAAVAGLVLITTATEHPGAAAPPAARPARGGRLRPRVRGDHPDQPPGVAAHRADDADHHLHGGGALTLAPFALVAGVSVPIRLDTVALLLHLGVVTTAVAYALFYAGLRTTRAASRPS